jgi:hypothetical protein
MRLASFPSAAALVMTLCLASPSAWAQEADSTATRYQLEVVRTAARQPGLVRYEIHALLPDSDRVSAVYGTDTHPLELRAPKGVFNSPYNGSWSSSGMNPKFFELMPDMQDDTYATIGLRTSAKLSGVMRAEDPTMVQDPSEPWDDFFTVNGETSLEVATHTGGSWFVLRTAANGAPIDGKVMLAQVTTSGNVSGAMNLQIFPAEPEIEQFRVRFEFEGTGKFPGKLVE